MEFIFNLYFGAFNQDNMLTVVNMPNINKSIYEYN